MKKLKLIICAFSIMPLFITSHVNAQSPDLVELNIPDAAIEKKAVHFSQRLSTKNLISFKDKGFTSVSDEYWFETTGKQLKSGVDLTISSSGALIRLSGKQTKGNYSISAKAIDPNSVQLFRNNKMLPTPFSQKVSQQEFATANIFPNSSAMKLNSKLGKGEFTLKVNDYLVDEQRYIVNVKEKNAEHTLHLSLAKQSYMPGQKIAFTSVLKAASTNKKVLMQGKQKAYIKTPSGEIKPVGFTKHNDQFQFTLPADLTSEKRGQLFELHVETENRTNDLKVKRNAKVAFAIAQPTARIETVGKLLNIASESGVITKNNAAPSFADISLQVASEGRYEISAVVYGSSGKKLSLPFMLSRSAYYLTPGDHIVKLQLNTDIIKNSGLKAPYVIKNVRLMDQSRLALLQQM